MHINYVLVDRMLRRDANNSKTGILPKRTQDAQATVTDARLFENWPKERNFSEKINRTFGAA